EPSPPGRRRRTVGAAVASRAASGALAAPAVRRRRLPRGWRRRRPRPYPRSRRLVAAVAGVGAVLGVQRDRRRKRHKPRMVKADEPVAQLATRIPKELHRRLKTYCVTHDIAVMHFVVEAIEEELVHWQY